MSPSPLDEAVRLKQAGRLDEAVIALEGVLSQAGASFPALIQLAEVQLRRDRLAEAEAALDRAEAMVGTTSRTASLRGDIHYKARRWAEAARSYGDADALGDKSSWALCRLAQSRLHLKDFDGARGAASRAVERDPDSAQPWVVLGDVALRAPVTGSATALARRCAVAPDRPLRRASEGQALVSEVHRLGGFVAGSSAGAGLEGHRGPLDSGGAPVQPGSAAAAWASATMSGE